MVRYCAVKSCRNTDASKNVRFFKAPTIEMHREIHKKWSKFAGQELVKNSFVCQMHFQDVDFVGEKKLRLRPGSIPSERCLDTTATHVVNLNVCSLSKYSLVKMADGTVLQVNFIHSEFETTNEVFHAKKVSTPKNLKPKPATTSCRLKRIGKGLPSVLAARQAFRLNYWKRLYLDHVKHTKQTKICKTKARHMVVQAKREVKQFYTAKLSNILTDVQISKVITGKRKVWTFREIALGLKLRYSKNTYENLRHLGYPFPSVETMRKYLRKIEFLPGIQDKVLDLIKHEFKISTSFRRQCVVIFDEMAINPRYEYFPSGDRVLGGKKNVSAFMVRGLFEPWKQVFAFNFCDRFTKNTFYEYVEKLELAGLVIRAVICDMGPKNRSLWKSLGIGIVRSGDTFLVNNSIRAPVNHNKIYFYADVPHLLKLLMNHTVAVGKGVKLETGQEINRGDFQHLIRREMPNDIKKLWRVLPEHLDMSNKDKMRVGPATHLFSHDTASVWRHEFPDREAEAKFIDLIASCFNILTSRPNSNNCLHEKKPFGVNLQEQQAILLATQTAVSKLRVIGSQCILPFQQGFMLSITSTRQLYEDLHNSNMKISFFYTSRTTQDAIENLFACLRGSSSNNMPTGVETIRRIKMHCLSSAPKISRNVNTSIDPDQVPMLTSSMLSSLIKKDKSETGEATSDSTGKIEAPLLVETFNQNHLENEESHELVPELETVVNVEQLDHVSEDEALDYVLGFVARKLVNDHPELSATKEEYDRLPNHWIKLLRHSTLTLPSTEWKTNGIKLNQEFLKLHGNALTLSIAPGVLKNFTKCLQLKYKDIPQKAVEIFSRLRLKIRMRHVNLSFARKSIQLFEIEKERIERLRNLVANIPHDTTQNDDNCLDVSEQHETSYEHHKTIFDCESFSWSHQVSIEASKIIGKPLHEAQRIAINAVLTGLDVILNMPTGSGKSAIFQLATLVSDGFTLIISPLVSLVEDQVTQLFQMGIPAINLTAGSLENTLESQLLTDIKVGFLNAKFLYVTPEKLCHCKLLLDALKNSLKDEKCPLSLVVIDEAHCYSEWGKSFRPDYLWLKQLKDVFPCVPVLAMSATLSQTMVQELKEELRLENAVVIREKTIRRNLHLNVWYCNDRESMVSTYVMQKSGQSGVIFCNTIRECEVLKQALCKIGVSCSCYHAKLHEESRKKLLSCWLKGSIRVMVATVAFGLGVNKPDCRFVVHYSLPATLNDYVQQCGRAGRDGGTGECVLIFGMEDTIATIGRVFQGRNGIENVHAVLSCALQSEKCRMKYLADLYDGGSSCTDRCQCDICQEQIPTVKVDVAEFISKSLEFIKKCNEKSQKVYAKAILDQLEGTSRDKSYPDLVMSQYHPRHVNEQLLLWSVANGYLEEEFTYGRIRTFVSLKAGHRTASFGSDLNLNICVQNR